MSDRTQIGPVGVPPSQADPFSLAPRYFSQPIESDEIGRLGRYRILERLGRGGMGEVFRGEDTVLGRKVAIKLLSVRGLEGPRNRERFAKEANMLALINHANVVRIYDVDEENGLPYIVMELLDGMSLDRYSAGMKVTEADILAIIRDIATGLIAVHSHGLVHRDIKSSNIWLDSTNQRFRLLDFGIAIKLGSNESERLTHPEEMIGTAGYVAPEQARGIIDWRSDFFSLGVVAYKLCTGKFPFKGDDKFSMAISALQNDRIDDEMRQINPDISIALESLINRLLSPDPLRRPQHASEILHDIASMVIREVAPIPEWAKSKTIKSEALNEPGNRDAILPTWLKRYKTDR